MYRITIKVIFLLFLLLGCTSDNDYHFQGQDLCYDSNGYPIELLTEEDINLVGIRKIYDKKVILQNDSLCISFKLISACCMEPKKNVIITTDSVIITPSFKGGDLCDCYCAYLFEYKFPENKFKDKKIKIH